MGLHLTFHSYCIWATNLTKNAANSFSVQSWQKIDSAHITGRKNKSLGLFFWVNQMRFNTFIKGKTSSPKKKKKKKWWQVYICLLPLQKAALNFGWNHLNAMTWSVACAAFMMLLLWPSYSFYLDRVVMWTNIQSVFYLIKVAGK